jgi:ElaB/YqjD/DUF883 family membrane-anchored ribosome-binding protein
MNNETSNQMLDQAAAAADHVAEQAAGAAQRGVAAVRNTSQQLLNRAHLATDNTAAYVKDEPVKSLLMAAAAGAALMALVGLLNRNRG